MQLTELRSYCSKRGRSVTGEYIDTGWSGATKKRPQFDLIIQEARLRRFDTVVFWKLGRWGRSIGHLIEIINELRQIGVPARKKGKWRATTGSVLTIKLLNAEDGLVEVEYNSLHLLVSCEQLDRHGQRAVSLK